MGTVLVVERGWLGVNSVWDDISLGMHCLAVLGMVVGLWLEVMHWSRRMGDLSWLVPKGSGMWIVRW